MIVWAMLLACGGPDDSGDSAAPIPTSGTLAVSFRIDSDYQALMDEPAVGTFYGAWWRSEDVSGIGPAEGASSLGDIRVDGVDLQAGPTGVLLVTGPLPIQDVVALGFLDSDGNADPNSPDPDEGDPVTLPGQNVFTVVGGEESAAEVFFGLLNP